ncbi:hypothetical protein B0H15DRAFT_175520 [Mycena belliarum]|uniref:Uncharacterized protein n=1 Tax=Mycena belliarum TaxID=1033014 RepID=A0AAD6U847_9AGAR|nr:hypothetical protein B0H15DRAFT_175520 [Mycena belliae]
MLRQLISVALAALVVVAAAEYAETVEGYKFITSGPRVSASKAEYEVATHKTAVELLKMRLGEEELLSLLEPDPTGAEPIWHELFANSTPSSWMLAGDNMQAAASIPNATLSHDELKTALIQFKERIGEDSLMAMLKPDIVAADVIWHEVIANSTPGSWVPAYGRAVCLLPNVTALGFAMWSASPLEDAVNNAANAEHYGKRTVEIAPGVLTSEILEGWGGVTTLFTVPNYTTPPNRTMYPFLDENPKFPYQGAGDKVLRDGTGAVFGVLHIAIRDVDGADYGETGSGIEISAAVWYGDGAGDDFLEAERQHMVIEIVNVALQAQKDIESGVFVVPSFGSKSK